MRYFFSSSSQKTSCQISVKLQDDRPPNFSRCIVSYKSNYWSFRETKNSKHKEDWLIDFKPHMIDSFRCGTLIKKKYLRSKFVQTSNSSLSLWLGRCHRDKNYIPQTKGVVLGCHTLIAQWFPASVWSCQGSVSFATMFLLPVLPQQS